MGRELLHNEWWSLLGVEESFVVNEDSSVGQLDLELLTVNLSGKVRREKMDGRDYLVAPLTMIVPGVLNGSKGALFYPLSEITENYLAWNNMPIVVNHPTDDFGKPCSARSPKILEKFGIGVVFNTQVSDRLIAEGWFDVEKTRRLSPTTFDKLQRGEVEELSTGLFTRNYPVQNGEEAQYNGKPYTHIARNYRPDHLAVLPTSKGACSVSDGCGVNVNQSSEVEESEDVSNKEGCASCGESCGCKSCKKKYGKKDPQLEEEMTDNESALWSQLICNSNSNRSEAVKKNEMIQELIANCSCWNQEDEKALNAMPDQKLSAIYNNHIESQRTAQELEEVRNAMKNADEEEMDEEEDEEETPTPPSKKKPTYNESRLTAEERRDLEWARNERQRRVDELIDTITSNERNEFTDEYLRTRSMDELVGLAALAAPAANEETEKLRNNVPVLNFRGQGGAHSSPVSSIVFNDQDEDMIPMDTDWSDSA